MTSSFPPLVPDLSITLDCNAIARAIFAGREVASDWGDKIASVTARIQPAMQPDAICRWFVPGRILEGRVSLTSLEDEEVSEVNLGAHVDEIASAEMVVCVAATLGESFDRAVAELTGSGDVLNGYLADCVGVYALLQVSRAVYRALENFASSRSWGVGRVLCPGAIEGWLLEGQQELCALLPVEQIGVSLNEAGVLCPARSVSYLIGTGTDYGLQHVTSPCNICTNTGICWCKC